MNPTAKSSNPTPGIPNNLVGTTEDNSIREYYMHYRHGMNSKLEKYFKHAGDLASARKRAQEHCNIMGYRLIWVRPLFIDLGEEEAQQMGRKENVITS